MKLSTVVLAGLVSAGVVAAGGSSGIRIEGPGFQRDVLVGNANPASLPQSAAVVYGKPPPETWAQIKPFFAHARRTSTPIRLAKRFGSRRGFRYGEGLGYRPHTRNAGRSRYARNPYALGIRYAAGLVYGSGVRNATRFRFSNRRPYNPRLQYGHARRYGKGMHYGSSVPRQ